jgi:hypothetical protein
VQDPLIQGEQVEQAPNSDQVQLGLVLLPNQLEVDPGYEAFYFGSSSNVKIAKQNPDGVRLWAKHFTPVGAQGGFDVPVQWSDFFTFSLLNLARFQWVKTLLGSKAWDIILKDKEADVSITFTIPRKCPANEPLTCPQCKENWLVGHDEVGRDRTTARVLKPWKKLSPWSSFQPAPQLFISKEKLPRPIWFLLK